MKLSDTHTALVWLNITGKGVSSLLYWAKFIPFHISRPHILLNFYGVEYQFSLCNLRRDEGHPEVHCEMAGTSCL